MGRSHEREALDAEARRSSADLPPHGVAASINRTNVARVF